MIMYRMHWATFLTHHPHSLHYTEFCMQIDAATEFAKGWDTLAVKDWLNTGNEYAVLSTIPLSSKDRSSTENGGAEVPRQCAIKIGSEGVPVSNISLVHCTVN
jgi:hypothetical protein